MTQSVSQFWAPCGLMSMPPARATVTWRSIASTGVLHQRRAPRARHAVGPYVSGGLAGSSPRRVRSAEELATKALEIGSASGAPDAFTWYGTQLMVARDQQGRLADLVRVIAPPAASVTDVTVEVGLPKSTATPVEPPPRAGFVAISPMTYL